MSALPAQVRKQIDRANQIVEQLKAPPSDPPPDPAATPAPVAAPAAATPPATPAEPPVAPAATPPATEDSAEHRYKVLQGKYNAEVPRLQQANRELQATVRTQGEQIAALNALVATLGGQRAAAPAAPEPTQPVRLVKDEEEREYGADLLDVVRRAAKEAVLPELDQRIAQKVAPVAQKVDQVAGQANAASRHVQQQNQQAVYRMLKEQVPNWNELNESPEFHTWLDQLDPYAGRPRGELLVEAYKSFDGPRVVAFFKGYLNEHAAVTPPAPAPATAPAATTAKLEELAVPGAPKAGAAGAQDGASNKRVWTRAEVTAFYREKQQGKFRLKPDVAKQMEADIFAAQREGRIRN